MKKSLSHLPKERRDDLRFITQCVREVLGDECVMVILYGSYARGTYVEYDQRTEYGVNTYFMSDYDILVVTKSQIKDTPLYGVLDKVSDEYHRHKGMGMRSFTTKIQFIDHDIEFLNKALYERRYFFTDIRKQGIVLYDSGEYKLVRRRKLNYEEKRDMAQEYYDLHLEWADAFLRSAEHGYNDKSKLTSFFLHQACEHLYHAILLTFTLYIDKEHDLEKLSAKAKSYVPEILKVFPRDTDEEKRIFKLLTDAYVQARYNPRFVVTKEDIEFARPKVELLRGTTKKFCEEKIAKYDKLSQKSTR